MKGVGSIAKAALATIIVAAAVTACEGGKTVIPEKDAGDSAPRMKEDFWDRGPTVFGNMTWSPGGDDEGGGGGAGIGVNSFLWRASLDTLSFLPLASADPFGGVIITDWYTPPESQNERLKTTVYILTRALRSDGVRVSVFRQVKNEAGDWVDAAVDEGVNRRLEDTILTRARQLRHAEVSSE